MRKSDEVIAGAVLYNPDFERLKKVIGAICVQVSELVLVDNGSRNIDEILDYTKENRRIHVIRNEENEGIAKGLNQICEYGVAHDYSWCLTLDQDTVCDGDMVSRLLHYCEDEKAGIVCPRVDYEGAGIVQKGTDSETVDVYACMTSGSLTRLTAWKELGGFRESYFIDFVDNEFCMRLGLAGYRIIRVNHCIMHHQLGEMVPLKVFGLFPRRALVHSPWRYYYMTRNNLLFIKQYRKHLRILREYAKLAKILYYGIVFTNTRKETCRYVLRGFRDARKNKEGRMELTLA